jgi:hypothetical protein
MLVMPLTKSQENLTVPLSPVAWECPAQEWVQLVKRENPQLKVASNSVEPQEVACSLTPEQRELKKVENNPLALVSVVSDQTLVETQNNLQPKNSNHVEPVVDNRPIAVAEAPVEETAEVNVVAVEVNPAVELEVASKTVDSTDLALTLKNELKI